MNLGAKLIEKYKPTLAMYKQQLIPFEKRRMG